MEAKTTDPARKPAPRANKPVAALAAEWLAGLREGPDPVMRAVVRHLGRDAREVWALAVRLRRELAGQGPEVFQERLLGLLPGRVEVRPRPGCAPDVTGLWFADPTARVTYLHPTHELDLSRPEDRRELAVLVAVARWRLQHLFRRVGKTLVPVGREVPELERRASRMADRILPVLFASELLDEPAEEVLDWLNRAVGDGPEDEAAAAAA